MTMDPHQRLGTLAEKLEFSNALLKQAQRDLKKERIEHGKTQSLVDELQHRIHLLTAQPTPPPATLEKATAEERAALRLDQAMVAMRKRCKGLQSQVNSLRATNNKLIVDLCRLEREQSKAHETPGRAEDSLPGVTAASGRERRT